MKINLSNRTSKNMCLTGLWKDFKIGILQEIFLGESIFLWPVTIKWTRCFMGGLITIFVIFPHLLIYWITWMWQGRNGINLKYFILLEKTLFIIIISFCRQLDLD